MKNRKLKDVFRLLTSIVACEGAGLVGAIFTAAAIPTWYATIQKPVFTPPSWLFLPVWVTLYLLMGIAVFLVWRQGLNRKGVRSALIIFGGQLILNALWSAAFFGLRSPFAGAVVIVALWISILLTILRFFALSTPAGLLLLPYILWVSFAAVLNISIWVLNP